MRLEQQPAGGLGDGRCHPPPTGAPRMAGHPGLLELATAMHRLGGPPFVAPNVGTERHRLRGVRLALDWLTDQPGDTWQQRWLASGAEAAAAA